jgi:hypothetical protein
MKTRFAKSAGLGLSLPFAVILGACAQTHAPVQGIMPSTIVIENTGATNLTGWRVLVVPGGSASWTSGARSGHAALPADLDAKLAGDVAAAKPLSAIPLGDACMKSVSFGTSIFISQDGDKSPDLGCAAGRAAHDLKSDADAVASFLHLRNLVRDPLHPLPPESFSNGRP